MSKTTIRKGKQDDKYCLAIREIQNSNADNKKCLDCEQRGPTYINITIGSFICTKCSGMLRGINPPHRIKSISMSSFTPEEVEMMRVRGNTWCSQVWLGTYNKATKPIDFKDEEKIRDFIIEKYEKKRYYVDPSQISKPKISPSTGSFQSALPETRPLSSLIGTSLKSSLANSSQGNISISRPGPTGGPAPAPVIKPPASDKIGIIDPSPAMLGTTSSSSTSLSASSTMTVSSTPDAFANFANFDTAAFDSLPADPLGPPASSVTLPPTKKISQPSAPTTTADAAAPERKVISASDRYAALKDLDDLFRTTTIESPVNGVSQSTNLFETPPAPIPSSNNLFSSETFGSGSPSVPNLFSSNGSPFGNGNSYGRSSPSYFGQQQQQQQQSQPPPWQAQWDKPISSVPPTFMEGNGGWPVEGSQGSQWRGGVQGVHPTNPFGTSPSGPPPFPSQLQPSDNNNDLFAAAPKPFLHEKSAVVDSNPWMTSVPAFTASMTPAPNPNNPFL